MHKGVRIGAVLAANLDSINASVGVKVKEVGSSVCEVESFGRGDDSGGEGHSTNATHEGS